MKLKSILKTLKKYRTEEEIEINEVWNIINQNSNCILLDVRSPQEYREGHLKGAMNIPLYELELNGELKDKTKTIIVYCRSGNRSKKAIKILKRKGYKNLYNLKGGLECI